MTTDLTQNYDFDFHVLFSSDLSDKDKGNEEHGVYSDGERDIINTFKDKYMAATTAFQRKTIARLEMLPKLFNYWKKEKGIIIYEKKELLFKSKVCSSFKDIPTPLIYKYHMILGTASVDTEYMAPKETWSNLKNEKISTRRFTVVVQPGRGHEGGCQHNGLGLCRHQHSGVVSTSYGSNPKYSKEYDRSR